MFNHELFTAVSGTYLSQLPGFVTAPTSKTTSSPTASDCLLFHLHPSRVSWAPLPQHSGTPDCCGCHRHLREKNLSQQPTTWARYPTPRQHISSRVMNLEHEKRQHTDTPQDQWHASVHLTVFKGNFCPNTL